MINRSRNMQEVEVQRSGIAQVLSSIPLVIWQAFLTLLFVFIVLSLLFSVIGNHIPDQLLSIKDFIDGVLTWAGRILFISALVIAVRLAYGLYLMIHDVFLKNAERKTTNLKLERLQLQNQQLRAKVQVIEQLPAVIKYAMENGHNVKFEGLEVSNYLSNVHTLGSMQQQAMIAPPVQDYLPEPYKFSDVLQNWQPSKDGILLAKKQELITVPSGEGLCHTTFTGNTDAGKTNNERFLLIQLLFLEQIVYLCDRNYQRYRMDKKMNCYYDYQPIANLLAHEPIDNAVQCLSLMKHLYAELEDRRARRRHNLVQFKDIYLMMDELPAFCGDEPEIMYYVGRFLRESRQYGIFFIGAAQDLLNQTLNNDNGAIRDNLLTNFYGGGDMSTARQVLALPKGETIDETGLGKQGITYLRAKSANIERVKARAPYADELATQMLLSYRIPVRKCSIPVVEPEPAMSTNVVPMRQSKAARSATLTDAIEVWNEKGEMGRPRLREELIARGLDCSDDRAKMLIKGIKAKLENA